MENLFNNLSKAAGNAIGTMSNLKAELKGFINQKIDSYMQSKNIVSREEFEVLNKMVSTLRQEQEELKKKIKSLEK